MMITDNTVAVKANTATTNTATTKKQPKIVLCTKQDHLADDLANEAAAYIMPFAIPKEGLLLKVESVEQTRQRVKRFRKVLNVVILKFENHEKALKLLNAKPLHDLAGRFGLELDDWNGREFRLFAQGEGYRISFK